MSVAGPAIREQLPEPDLFNEVGQTARELSNHDWSAHPLGRPEDWPPLLKSWIRTILGSAQSMYIVWGPSYAFFSNDAYRPLLGSRVGEAIGTTLPALWPDVWEDVRGSVDEAFAGTSSRFEDRELNMMRQGEPERTWWTFSFTPIRQTDGSIPGVLCITNETTSSVVTRRDLADLDFRRRLATEIGEVGIWDFNLVTSELTWDDNVRKAFGLAYGRKPLQQEKVAAVHVEDRPAFDHAFARALAGDDPFDLQFRVIGIDDAIQRWLSAKGQVIFEDGKPVRFVGAMRDVSERVASDQRRRLLNQELSHRLKNTLAIVSSIISQTLRSASDVGSARTALSARIQALAKAHDILLSGQRDSAGIGNIVGAAVSLHDEGKRVRLLGPSIPLGPKASLTLSLIVHELATNSGKYGALSDPDGAVDVEWDVLRNDPSRTPQLAFSWTESKGPAVAAPMRKGFGTRLIEMGLSSAPGASSTIDYASDGLRCRLVAPLAELMTENEADGAP